MWKRNLWLEILRGFLYQYKRKMTWNVYITLNKPQTNSWNMGSHIIDILRQGIWASVTGGWFSLHFSYCLSVLTFQKKGIRISILNSGYFNDPSNLQGEVSMEAQVKTSINTGGKCWKICFGVGRKTILLWLTPIFLGEGCQLCVTPCFNYWQIGDFVGYSSKLKLQSKEDNSNTIISIITSTRVQR
jgi:hypothetical protein